MDALESNIKARCIFGKVVTVNDPESIVNKYTQYGETIHNLYDNLDKMSNVKVVPELKPDDKLQLYLLKKFKEYKRVIKPRLSFGGYDSSSLMKLRSFDSVHMRTKSNLPEMPLYKTSSNFKPLRLASQRNEENRPTGELITTPRKGVIPRHIITSSSTIDDPFALKKSDEIDFKIPNTERAKFFKSVLNKSPMKVNLKKSVLNKILKDKKSEQFPSINTDNSTISREYPQTDRGNKYSKKIIKGGSYTLKNLVL
jgi:hypothetical protein